MNDIAQRPSETEYAPFYATYVSLVPETDVLAVLDTQAAELRRIARAVSPEKETYRYAPGKWSLRELFGHLSDGERVFGHRAFCISRGEQAALPGFDEQTYVANAGYERRQLAELAEEFETLRKLNLSLLRRLAADDWKRSGVANGKPVSVRALAFVMAGHVRHHLGIVRSRYGITAGA
jgi:hypothetical protein